YGRFDIASSGGRQGTKRPPEGSSSRKRQGPSEGRILPVPAMFMYHGFVARLRRASASPRLDADELTRVHDVVRVESAFDPAHQLDLDRRLVMSDLVALEAANTVLGADRARELAHDTVDEVVEFLPTRQIGMPVGTFRLGQVEVDVAVADMAEGHRPDTR